MFTGIKVSGLTVTVDPPLFNRVLTEYETPKAACSPMEEPTPIHSQSSTLSQCTESTSSYSLAAPSQPVKFPTEPPNLCSKLDSLTPQSVASPPNLAVSWPPLTHSRFQFAGSAVQITISSTPSQLSHSSHTDLNIIGSVPVAYAKRPRHMIRDGPPLANKSLDLYQGSRLCPLYLSNAKSFTWYGRYSTSAGYNPGRPV